MGNESGAGAVAAEESASAVAASDAAASDAAVAANEIAFNAWHYFAFSPARKAGFLWNLAIDTGG